MQKVKTGKTSASKTSSWRTAVASGRSINSRKTSSQRATGASSRKTNCKKVNGKKASPRAAKPGQTFKKTFHDYLAGKIRPNNYQRAGVGLLVWVISGIVGWVYEFLVAWLETGQIYMKGGNLLPWINIYAIGAVILMPVVYKLRRNPLLVFLAAVIITGLVELIGGWLVYTIGNGTRYWNYTEGIWSILSINGFVCLASVTFFGIGALALTYLIMPVLTLLALRMTKHTFLTLAIVIFAIFMLDEIVNLTLKNLDQPTAVDFYKSLGMKYQEF